METKILDLLNEPEKHYCLVCGEPNIIEDNTMDTWQCYSCSQSWWMNELSKDKYMLRTGRSEEEADEDIFNNNPTLIICHGEPDED